MEPSLALYADGWELTDGTVSLRPLLEADITAVATAIADPVGRDLIAHWVRVPPRPAAARRDAVREVLLDDWAGVEPFAVTDYERRVVGVRWLEYWDAGEWSCGGWIDARHRGRGLGSAALRLACHHAARSLDGTEIVTGTRVDNTAAKANLAACGFSFRGLEEPTAAPGCRVPVEGMETWGRDLADLAERGPIPVDRSL